MNANTKAACELLADNLEAYKKDFHLETQMLLTGASALLAVKGLHTDTEKLKECDKILANKFNVLSEFRGNMRHILLAKMSMQDDPGDYLDRVSEVYDKLHKKKFFDSAYKLLAAASICDAGKYEEADQLIERTNEIMKKMNKTHPFLVDEEDTGTSLTLAFRDGETDTIVAEVNEIYDLLKPHFKMHNNAAHSLAQILSASEGSPSEKADRVVTLYNTLKENDVKYGKDVTLPTLAMLMNLGIDDSTLAREIKETAEFLKERKGFKALDMGSETRLMYASLMVATSYTGENSTLSDAVLESTLSIVITNQLLLLMIMMSTTSALSHASH